MTPAEAQAHEARARETREWLSKASGDLASARILSSSGQLANALFFCQQAADKSLKGFLTWHQTPFPRTHDLGELGEACVAIDATLAVLIARADILTDYAWKLRYPGSQYVPELEETVAMLALSDTIFKEIQTRLPKEASDY